VTVTQTSPPRGNTLRPLRVSTLVVDLIELGGVTRKFAQCPCGTHVQVKRHELSAHSTPAGARCDNSRRTLINDLEEADWASAYDRTARQIERSRASRPQFSKPTPPLGRAVAHIGRPSTTHPAQTAGHGAQVLADLDRETKKAAREAAKKAAREEH
jgi:hypothetical protein